MTGDSKDGHNEGDVGATGEGWQEMNCYLEETASGFSFSFNSGTSSLSRFNSKVRFSKSNHAFMVLADSLDTVRLLVPLLDGSGSSSGPFNTLSI